MRSTVLRSAALGALLAGGAVARGLAADSAALLDAPTALGGLARALAGGIGEPAALGALVVLGGLVAGASLGAVVRSPAAVLLLAAPPLLTGAVHATPALWALGPALAALRAWPHGEARGAAWIAVVAAVSPPAAVATAVVAFGMRPGVVPLLVAVLAASVGHAGVVDPAQLGAPWLPAPGRAAGATAGLLLAPALVLVGGDRRLRLGGLVAAALALGPVLLLRGAQGQLQPVALPALPFAALGAEAGWAEAGVAAVAALALAGGLDGGRRAAAAGLLVAAEGVLAAWAAPSPLPASPPEAVASLAERPGRVLHLPVGRIAHGEPPRAALWRHQAWTHGRPLYADGHAVNDGDPVLAEPGVAAVTALLDPEREWLIPPTPVGTVLRALGVTELVLDRAALDAEALARLDPVLARLYGPPQRDVAGGVDLWRIAPTGEQLLPNPPYLRSAGAPDTTGWRTLEATLQAEGAPTRAR